MEKIKCFSINNIDLFLEQVLVDYQEVPIFYLCKGNDEYYVVLCEDFDELKYIIVKPNSTDILNMLYGKLEMRKLFEKQSNYWEVISGETIEDDIVIPYGIEKLDLTVLPEDNAFFEALTDNVRNYIREFERGFFGKESFVEYETNISENEFSETDIEAGIIPKIEEYTELGTWETKSNFEVVSRKTINYNTSQEDFKVIKADHKIDPLKVEMSLPDAA